MIKICHYFTRGENEIIDTFLCAEKKMKPGGGCQVRKTGKNCETSLIRIKKNRVFKRQIN